MAAGIVKNTTNSADPIQNSAGGAGSPARRASTRSALGVGRHGAPPRPRARARSQQVAIPALVVADEVDRDPVLDDAPVIEHDDVVDRVQRRQAVGDDQRRPALDQRRDGASSRSSVSGRRGRSPRRARRGPGRAARPGPARGAAPPRPTARRRPAPSRGGSPVGELVEADARSASITASSVGVSSNSVTLSRTVPRTARPPAARARPGGGARRAGSPDRDPPSDTEPASARSAGARAARTWSCRSRCADDADRRPAPIWRSTRGAPAGRRRSRSRPVEVDGERPGGGLVVPVVDDRRLDAEQVADAHHRAVRLLHGLELVDDVFERPRDQQHVLVEQEAVPRLSQSRETSHAPTTSTSTQPAAIARLHEPPHDEEGPLAAERAGDRLGAVLDEPPRAWFAAPLDRRSSAAFRRSSMPP